MAIRCSVDKRWIPDVHDIVILIRHSVAPDVRHKERCAIETHVRNPIFLTGDWHSTFVNNLKLDFKDPSQPTVATEFVTPAITTGGDDTPYGPYYAPMIPFNPHIQYYEGDRRGYFAATVTPERMRLDLRFVTSVENPGATGYAERSWFVEDGVPGAVPA